MISKEVDSVAIQMKLEMETGVVLPEAYVRITEGILSLDRGIVFITVQTYANRKARDEGRPAVLIYEARCTHEGAQEERGAEYHIEIANAEVGQGSKFTVSLDKDAKITLIEGTHVTTDGTIATYTNKLVEKLNENDDFSLDYIASYEGEGSITIKALDSGSKSGSKGNGLSFSGDTLYSVQKREGKDQISSDFERYFGIDVMDIPGNNVIKQGYEFIKSLPEYQGGIDVL